MGTNNEPPLRFSLGCQEEFFLNDAGFLDGACKSNGPERIRPVTLNLTGPVGTNGTVTLSVEGGANPVVFHVVDGATNLVTASTEIPLAVTNDVSYTGSYTIYVSCPNLGTGTITATFTPSGDNIEPLTASATFRCVEPLRKLVTTDKVGGRYVNPSRLVMGTNAVLKVSANGPFSSSEVDWRLVSGSADVVPNGWSATVTPTGLDTVVVEARFNDDEIQPRFVLPVVQPRTIPVRVFVVQPPENIGQDVAEETDNMNVAWTNQEICRMFDTANEIFTQVGIHFELIEGPVNIGRTKDWTIFICDTVTNSAGEVSYSDDVSTQMVSLLNHYRTNDCVEVYFTGHLLEPSVDAITCPLGMIISKNHTAHTLAHELGHTLGLKDIFHRLKVNDDGQIVTVNLGIRQHTIDKTIFADDGHDWCLETGIGFYERNDTIASVIDKLLMCGIEDSDVDAVSYGDIPYGKVYGLSKYLEKGFQKVGVSEIEPSNGKVYSR